MRTESVAEDDGSSWLGRPHDDGLDRLDGHGCARLDGKWWCARTALASIAELPEADEEQVLEIFRQRIALKKRLEKAR